MIAPPAAARGRASLVAGRSEHEQSGQGHEYEYEYEYELCKVSSDPGVARRVLGEDRLVIVFLPVGCKSILWIAFTTKPTSSSALLRVSAPRSAEGRSREVLHGD